MITSESDKLVTNVLVMNLLGQNAYTNTKDLLAILEEREPKPTAYEQLKVIVIKARLLYAVTRSALLRHPSNLTTYLKEYSEEWLKRPGDLIALSQLRVDNSDPSSKLIVDVIKQEGHLELNKQLIALLKKKIQLAKRIKDIRATFSKMD